MPGLELPGVADSNVWIAAADGDIEIVEHFLKRGGPGGSPLDANVKDISGYTPMHAAAAYGHLELLDLLVNTYNGNVNVTDEDGDTPLHVVENVNMARKLIQLGADVRQENLEGLTPIAVANEEERKDIVEYLWGFTPEFEPTTSSQDEADGFEDDSEEEKDNDGESCGSLPPTDRSSSPVERLHLDTLHEALRGMEDNESIEIEGMNLAVTRDMLIEALREQQRQAGQLGDVASVDAVSHVHDEDGSGGDDADVEQDDESSS
ncbi:ankyrin repeat-containing domain protein [Phlyctochytrium arcticum]|nr:ankyrin repeat-containing domain protein [Phlyctochytrium arcticum]